jgi:hypothetical protein
MSRSRPAYRRLAALNSLVLVAVFVVLAASPAPVHFPSTHWEAVMLAAAAALVLVLPVVLGGAALAERVERGRRAATATGELVELRRYEHYDVDATDGRIGLLDEVLGDRDGAAKVMVVSDGWFGARRFVVPVDAIRFVDDANRIVTVAESPRGRGVVSTSGVAAHP